MELAESQYFELYHIALSERGYLLVAVTTNLFQHTIRMLAEIGGLQVVVNLSLAKMNRKPRDPHMPHIWVFEVYNVVVCHHLWIVDSFSDSVDSADYKILLSK